MPEPSQQDSSTASQPSFKQDETADSKLFPGLYMERNIPQWAYFGQPGHVQTTRVTRGSWKNAKPFKKPISVDWVVPLPNSEGASLRLLTGFRPVEMEDKWFIYADGPTDEESRGISTATMHFHRSWTGLQIAAVKMELSDNPKAAEECGRIVSLMFESETNTKDSMTELENMAKYCVVEICRHVLGVTLEPPESLSRLYMT